MCFQQLHTDPECRAVVLSGAGRLFCAGIDLAELASLGSVALGDGDVARKAFKMHTNIKRFQDWITDLELVSGPPASDGVSRALRAELSEWRALQSSLELTGVRV